MYIIKIFFLLMCHINLIIRQAKEPREEGRIFVTLRCADPDCVAEKGFLTQLHGPETWLWWLSKGKGAKWRQCNTHSIPLWCVTYRTYLVLSMFFHIHIVSHLSSTPCSKKKVKGECIWPSVYMHWVSSQHNICHNTLLSHFLHSDRDSFLVLYIIFFGYVCFFSLIYFVFEIWLNQLEA